MKYHYTYRITNILLSKHYYGTRTSNNRLPKDDIGIYYFSSSSDREFIQDQKQNPFNYKYKVIKIFNTRKEAMLLEIKLHNKFNVGLNKNFYNRAKQTSIGFDTSGITFTNSEETKYKKHLNALLNNNFKDKTHSDEQKLKWSNERKGKPQQGGVSKHSNETKIKISETQIKSSRSKGKNNPCFGLTDTHPMAKTIGIYNSSKDLLFETKGNFKKICELNSLPFGPLTKSYQNNGSIIFQSSLAKTRAKKNNTEHFIGWFAKII